MFSLIFISGVLAVLAQGQVNCPSYKYYTVNTFKPDSSFSFSCYGKGSDCTVYYVPPGSGCNGDSLEFIGTVSEDETINFEPSFLIEVGGGFCSDYQVGVFSPDGNDLVTAANAYLPAATEAGNLFHLGLFNNLSSGRLSCVASALSMPATVSIAHDDDIELLSIDPYMFQTFAVGYPDSFSNKTILNIKSDSPIIVSCTDDAKTSRLVTLQNISSEPVLIDASKDSVLTMVISNCSTNELITDNSTVLVSQTGEDGMPCQSAVLDDEIGFTFRQPCLVLVEPLDNVCVSVGLQTPDDSQVSPGSPGTRKYPLISMGLPKSKLSPKFGADSKIDSVNLLSFSNTTCTGYVDGIEKNSLNLNWVAGELDGKVSLTSWLDTYSTLSVLECANPVLVVPLEDPYRAPFLAGYQSKDLWQNFFDSEGCIDPPTPDPPTPDPPTPTPDPPTPDPPTPTPDPPTPDTPDTPGTSNVTGAPTASDARSLVTSWVVFFGFYIFASSLV